MPSKLMVRLTAPIMAMSLLPLAVGAVTAWNVHQSQKKASDAVALNVTNMRAAEEVAIGVRDVRLHLDRFLLTGDRAYLDAVPGLRQETGRWLAVTERAAATAPERQLTERVRQGYDRFFADYGRITEGSSSEDLPRRIRDLLDADPTDAIVAPAQEYLDLNEEEIARSSADNQETADQVVRGLLLLGVCGPVSGLLAGYGIARALSRSIIRLSVPICDAAGKLNEIVSPITLSPRWSLEELEVVLRKLAGQVGAVVERLQQSQREVLRAEQLAAVGQLAAGMAHELRNPLMSMKLLVQAAAERGPAPSLDGRDLAVVEEEITRLERLTQMFLDFARPPNPEKHTFAAQAVVEQTAGLVARRARLQGVRLECDLPREPVLVQADAGQLRQVVLNLVLNALDATPGGGVVALRLRAAGPWLELRVSDTGPGLPAELGPRIFEPFVSTKETGVGLGLSICRRIAEAHGGDIRAGDRPGGGAAFTVRLPLAPGR